MTGTSFDKFRGKRRQRGGTCSICGQPAGGRVAISLQERKKNENARNGWSYPSIDSRSATFCEPHAVEVYERTVAALRGPD